MQEISDELKDHLQKEVTTLCYCWLLTTKNSISHGFTSHDKDIIIDNSTYLASSGFSPSSITNNSELAVDNLEIAGVLDNINLKESDITAGVYDFAKVEIFMVNYKNISNGKFNLKTGWLGEVKFSQNRFVAEVRGLTQKLSQNIGQLYSSRCRTIFADSKCGLNINDFKKLGIIENVISNSIFVDTLRIESSGFYNYGKVKFISGNNKHHIMEIKRFSGNQIELVLPLPFNMKIGDEYEIFQGCDKNFSTCINLYGNAVNFRGEPHIPGLDKTLRTA